VRWIDAASGTSLRLPKTVEARGKLYFHPDGRRLLGNFSDSQDKPPPKVSLAWFDLVTGAVRPVLPRAERAQVFCLSPDGEDIAFATSQDVEGEQSGNRGPEADVWMVPAQGGQPRQLARFRSRIFNLWWYGEALYFSTDLGGAHNDLWAMPIRNPASARKLTFGQADEDSPSLSHDGRWLVYTDNRENATALVLRDLMGGQEKTLTVSQLDFGQPVGKVRLLVSEKGSQRPLTARLSLRQEGGKYFAPAGSLYRILAGEGLEHFYCSGEAELTVPAGKYQLRAFRGLEYRETRKEFEVPANETVTVQAELERWADPSKQSWYSGESHIHANYGYGHWYNTAGTMRLQIEGENLNVANFMVANSDTDGVFDREFFRGSPDPSSTPETVLYWNEEFRATLWGHMTLLNLTHLVEPVFTGFHNTTNPWDTPTNADIADQTHLQGGHVNFTHPAGNRSDPFLGAYSAKSLPVDVALGKIDSLDINWSSLGSGEAYQATLSLWYRFLNCRLRLPASAGTDCFLNRIHSRLPGGDRAYVKIEGPFSYLKWIEALKAGRSFVTNGPLLDFRANGRFLGETLRLQSGDQVTIEASAVSQFPLTRVELIYGGNVLASGTLSADRLRGTINQQVKLDSSGWFSFRAFDEKGLQAHTSPIYVEIPGTPAGSRTDAQYFLQWIDRLESMLNDRKRLPSPEIVTRVQGQLNAARAVYRRVIDQRHACP
jgi:hypothetical protein